MRKTILITGSTDGIGLATAKQLISDGHQVLIHGRNATKLEEVATTLSQSLPSGQVDAYQADLSRMSEVIQLAHNVARHHGEIDVLINNAGIFRTSAPIAENGMDVRFMVNTIAPYVLTQHLLPQLNRYSRVVNLSSAAQAPIDIDALSGHHHLDDEFQAYAQSKLALTIWSREMALDMGKQGPTIVAVNPGSMLGSKMVQEGFGVTGGDIGIGADILARAALSDEFMDASGQYFDNDSGKFAAPHQEALNPAKVSQVMAAIDLVSARLGG